MVAELGVRSSIGVPLSIAGERHGVVLAASGTPDFFDEEDLAFLKTVSQWIGLVASRLALAEHLAREAAEAAYRAGVEHTLTLLTPRQRQVAALIARGLTNAEIAEQLVLTEGTVANHIEHILRRLGYTSRAQVAALVGQLKRG